MNAWSECEIYLESYASQGFEGFMEFFEFFHAAENVENVDGVLLVLNYCGEWKNEFVKLFVSWNPKNIKNRVYKSFQKVWTF